MRAKSNGKATKNARRFGSWHSGICNFLFCDGTVKSLSTGLDVNVMRRLAVRNDGQPVGNIE